MAMDSVLTPEDVTGVKQLRTKVYGVKLTPEEFEALQAAAARRGMKLPDYVRTLLLAEYYARLIADVVPHLKAVGQPVPNAEGAVWKIMAVVTDLLDKIKEAEETLQGLKGHLTPALLEVLRAFQGLGMQPPNREEGHDDA
jgi:hypothetical protein